MSSTPVTILTAEPTVAIIADMQLDADGVNEMVEWVKAHRPACLPDNLPDDILGRFRSLFPHDTESSTDNELLVELAGRKCYDSFGLKAGKRTNADYIANTQNGDVPHRSIMYHAKMSFFIAGVSRRVSHELIRNYVGSDREEEGSPSQESTRYTHHYGFYIAHPRDLVADNNPGAADELAQFERDMQANYDAYLGYIDRQVETFKTATGAEPVGMSRKRIYEAASARLSHACETSWVWTTNPIAIAKLCLERDNDGADLEFRRLARKWKRVCVERWPAIFPQPWMRT